MCIIMTKPEGVQLPSKETFRDCYHNNPDGCGFMYVEDGKVVIEKGYMGYKNMYKRIKHILRERDRNIVVHFRIGTSGTNDQRTTHPYPIESDTDLLQTLRMTTDLAMVHNGIISGYDDKTRPDLNDTQIFIRDVLSIFKEMNPYFYKTPRVADMLEDMTGSKLCFLDDTDTITYVGHFYDVDGVMYSNTTYKPFHYVSYNDYKNYGTLNDEFSTPYGDEIYDDYTYDTFPLWVGDQIELANGNVVQVRFNNMYVYDKLMNVYLLDDASQLDVLLYSNVRLYDANNEELDGRAY